MKSLRLKKITLGLGCFALALLAAMSTPVAATSYRIQAIPAPLQIVMPAGNAGRKVCRSINDAGQVACTLEIIEQLTPTQLDRGRIPKLFASYAYVWNSNAVTSAVNPRLLSSLNADTLDRANVINSRGWVGGSINSGKVRRPQAAIWLGASAPVLRGLGDITDLDANGDYVNNGQLFVHNLLVSFPGTNVQVHVINPLVPPVTGIKPAGQQMLSSTIGQSGEGLLFSARPSPNAKLPWFALSGIRSGFRVRDITDNGNFVISGEPSLTASNLALNCTGQINCQLYFPTVGTATAGKTNRWITLNGVNKTRNAVGTDGGIGIRIDPPTGLFPNGREINLNLEPGIVRSRLSLSEGTAINTRGQIIGFGLLGSQRTTVLITPI